VDQGGDAFSSKRQTSVYVINGSDIPETLNKIIWGAEPSVLEKGKKIPKTGITQML